MLEKHLQNLYNNYLYASRTTRGKAFSPRKDFQKFDPKQAYYLKRICNLLDKYEHIKAEDYFAAPYLVYPDQDHFGLDFFAGMPAVKAFTILMKQKRELPPDSDYQIEKIAESLKFIAHFCMKKRIPLSEYTSYQTGITYDWMKHVKKHQVSLYTLMEFSDVYDKIGSIEGDERELFLGDSGKYYLGYKAKYLKSVKARHLVSEGVKKIKNVIESSR